MIPPIHQTEKRLVALLLAASFALFSLYSLATPLFEASDEAWHYPFVQHLANGGGLPIQRADQTDADAPWRQEGSQPPLYYALAALVTAPIDDTNWREIQRLNPHSDLGLATRDGNINVVLHTKAEQFPWAGAALAVRLARLLSVVLSTLTVGIAYLIARAIFPAPLAGSDESGHSAWLRIGTLVFTACVPMFAFISGSINNDNAAVLFSTMGVWWALRIVRRRDTTGRAAIIAGLIASAGALSKSSALGLIGLFGLAAALASISRDAQRQSPALLQPWRHVARLALDTTRFTSVVALVVAVCAGWWFVRNQILYGDLLGWNAFLDVVGRRSPPASLAQLWTEREGFARSYWGVFGAMNVLMPPLIYDALNGMSVVAAAGLVWSLFRPRSASQPSPGEAIAGMARTTSVFHHLTALICRRAAAILGLFWVGLIFVAFLRWTSLTPASQGRLMFPCIAVIAAGLSYGLFRIHRAALWAGMALLATVAVVMPFAVIAPAYAPPPNTWTERLPIPISADFGGVAWLDEGRSSSERATPGDEVTLYLNWKLAALAPANYSVFVHLIDEHDVIVAQRDMYPGQGRLALSEEPAGRLWSDFYTVRIPALAHAPRVLRWAVGVYDFTTGQRLRLPDGADRVIFGAVSLNERTDADSALLRYENGLELLGYTLGRAEVSPGETLTVTTRWRASRPLERDLSVSLQLLDGWSNKAAQQDAGQPLAQWTPGEAIEITHALAVDTGASPGVYRLLLVWYAPADFSRAVAYGTDGQVAGDQIELTRLRVR